MVLLFLLLSFFIPSYTMQPNIKEHYEKSLQNQNYLCVPWPNANDVIALLKIPEGKDTFVRLVQQPSLKSDFNPIDLLHNLIHSQNEQFLAAEALSICIQTAKKYGHDNFPNTRYYNRIPGYLDTEGTSLLRDCVKANNIPCARVLLREGADTNQWEPIHRHSNAILYPLLEAFILYGKESKMYKMLEASGATFLPCDEQRYNQLESTCQRIL